MVGMVCFALLALASNTGGDADGRVRGFKKGEKVAETEARSPRYYPTQEIPKPTTKELAMKRFMPDLTCKGVVVGGLTK
jgi:hypothetical protein